MATVVFAYDHARDPMNPDQLADQIAAAASLAVVPQVDITPTEIIVTHPSITEANRTALQNLINAYVFDPVWAGGVQGVLKAKMLTALSSNADYLAIANPTAAQVTTQVRRLTMQTNALIRLVADKLDSTSGT